MEKFVWFSKIGKLLVTDVMVPKFTQGCPKFVYQFLKMIDKRLKLSWGGFSLGNFILRACILDFYWDGKPLYATVSKWVELKYYIASLF